jgi:hypothetical protein
MIAGVQLMTAQSRPLPYLPAMFGACMVFQTLYLACLGLWALFPALPGHAILVDIFPQFELLTVWSFIYGLIASMIYGWIVASVFVFFYNLWIGLARLLAGNPKASA